MLLDYVFGFLPKYASNGVILLVVLGIRFKFSMIANILFARFSFDHFSSMLIATSGLFSRLNSLSTIPVPLWSPVGASISFMLLYLQNFSKFFFFERLCVIAAYLSPKPWNPMYSLKYVSAVSMSQLIYTSAYGYCEYLSIVTNM